MTDAVCGNPFRIWLLLGSKSIRINRSGLVITTEDTQRLLGGRYGVSTLRTYLSLSARNEYGDTRGDPAE